ncbi:hypothetical protein MMPV_007756 [Pyropia vietnamensis]
MDGLDASNRAVRLGLECPRGQNHAAALGAATTTVAIPSPLVLVFLPASLRPAFASTYLLVLSSLSLRHTHMLLIADGTPAAVRSYLVRYAAAFVFTGTVYVEPGGGRGRVWGVCGGASHWRGGVGREGASENSLDHTW